MRLDEVGPYSLERLKALAPPILFSRDAAALREQYVKWFEEVSGRPLFPMQVEMLLIETLAYAMAMLGEEAQAVAEAHLVAFAPASALELLGVNRSTPRLPAARARVTLRFSLAEARQETTLIPAGARVSAGGAVTFATMSAGVIPIGALYIDLTAEAVESGEIGNGFLAGQITTMLDPIAGVGVTNATISAGGADIESVELYRLRLANAFERISSGGSFSWYRETAIGVSAALIDVAVVRPQPCIIDIYPLTVLGAAGVDLRAQVLAAFNTNDALNIRFGDDVYVKPPVAVTGSGTLTVRGRNMPASIQADAAGAAELVLKVWRERLGSVVAPSDIEAAIKALPGVIDAELAGIAFQQLQKFEFFVATSLTINVVVLP